MFTVALLVYFEKTVRTARIVSDEVSDRLGSYSRYAKSEGGALTVDDPDEEGPDLVPIRILLREIAQNSYLPLTRSEAGAAVYAGFSIALLCFQLIVFFVAKLPLFGQNAKPSSEPPLFEGIMVDARGKTVGRLDSGGNFVVRQIRGIWTQLAVADLQTDLYIWRNRVDYFYESEDCRGDPLDSPHFK
jgi:hypothetical protein